MTDQEKKELWDNNVAQIDLMYVPAGSMVKAMVLALEDNGLVYIRLGNAAVEGHTVDYVFVEGADPTLVPRVAASLGLKVNETTIEVPHA